jgi:zinc transport system substrate-binding protein
MRPLIPALAALMMLAGACGRAGGESGASEGPEVIAAFYPLEFVAAEVVGRQAIVTNLSPPGVEPHDLELAPGQVRSLAQADLVVYIGGGFQPAVEDVIDELSGIPTIDAIDTRGELIEADNEGHESEEGAADPHVWLDPNRLAFLGHAVAREMAEIDGDHSDVYESNAEDLEDALDKLDEEYSTALENCARNELVVSHEAFGYLTDRYGLEQVGVSGIDPESEPSPGRVAEVAEFAKAHGVTTIFFEEQVAPDIARVIADEIGAGVEVLDPLEFKPEGESDYFDVMRKNLDSISTALGCN